MPPPAAGRALDVLALIARRGEPVPAAGESNRPGANANRSGGAANRSGDGRPSRGKEGAGERDRPGAPASTFGDNPFARLLKR